MGDPYYETLMFFIFFCVGLYLNRRGLRSLEHEVFGRYMPEYIISVVFSLVIAIFVWIMLHVILWTFS